MSKQRRRHEIPPDRRAQEHLANERTFLAWVRTTIALISLGFILGRAGPVLAGGDKAQAGMELMPIGLGLTVLGTLLTILAAWRYGRVNQQIDAGVVETDRALVWFVTAGIVSVSGILAFSLLITGRAP